MVNLERDQCFNASRGVDTKNLLCAYTIYIVEKSPLGYFNVMSQKNIPANIQKGQTIQGTFPKAVSFFSVKKLLDGFLL